MSQDTYFEEFNWIGKTRTVDLSPESQPKDSTQQDFDMILSPKSTGLPLGQYIGLRHTKQESGEITLTELTLFFNPLQKLTKLKSASVKLEGDCSKVAVAQE